MAVVLIALATLVSCTSAGSTTSGTPTTSPTGRPDAGAGATAPGFATEPPAACGNPTESLRPAAGPPRASDYRTDGSLARVLERGYLIVGIDQSAFPFGYADVTDHNRLKGFDIDLVRQITADLFGSDDPSRLRFRVVPNNIREQSVANGTVDMVAKSVTVNCRRRAVVDFSSVYYESGQRLLVVDDTPAAAADHTKGLTGLPTGTRVCTVGGTTAADAVHATRGLIDVTGDNWTDCLVRIQQGQADAAIGDDTVMAGLQAQDRFIRVVGPKLTREPYGLEIGKGKPDLVRFVNASLERIRRDGTWRRLFDTYLARYIPESEGMTAPEAEYRD
ncbi:transporter substrate-binding domain-containing protein [Embleya hyalina]|uniref:transporter substrate-binding domain-containing protein n=1 Tax=Embleya hyalina TaxID=516124 RepID=UPI000F84402A|nr:transporter substrate-binding domain-containing protein [Embleya hyalina]